MMEQLIENKEQFKPCPFCGSEISMKNTDCNIFFRVVKVMCPLCGASLLSNPHEITEKWNTRV